MESLIFGLFDGFTSSLGLTTAMPVFSLRAVAALGLAAGLGMGVGEWLADNQVRGARAIQIGAATLLGTLLPALPYLLLPRSAAFPTAAWEAVAVGYGLAWVRRRGVRGLCETYGLLAVVLAVTSACGVA